MGKDGLSQFAEYQTLEILKENIMHLPDLMTRGLELVYPEKRVAYLDFLLDRAKEAGCYYIDNALRVMQALEDGKSVEEANKLVGDDDVAYAAVVRSTVLSWSKRGPEFFYGTLPFSYDELDETTKQEIARIEEENEMYAQRQKRQQ